jgi:excisionase family DNA binding protein
MTVDPARKTDLADEERLVYTIAEAAQLLGIGRRQAYEAARRGELPTIRMGARLLVPRFQLEKLLDGQ